MAKTETITDVLRREGWLIAGTNPKLKKSRLEEKNYGIAQAKKIADALNHIFVEIEDLNKFESFLRKNEILRDARFDDFVNFLAKPFYDLSKRDADKFLNFLYEFAEWEKKNNRKAKDEYFICQNRMNLIALKSFFSFCFERDIVDRNILAGIKIPVNQNRTPKNLFSLKQLREMFNDRMVKSIDTVFASSPEYRALKFAGLSGMRSSEVRALRWKQISHDNHVVEINSAFKIDSTKRNAIGKPKWEKTRTIVVCDSAVECLGMRGNPESFVFHLKGGGAIGSSKYIKSLETFLDKLDRAYIHFNQPPFTLGKHYTPHSFRGSLNSLLLSGGTINEAIVQEYLGWTKTALTQVQRVHYTKFKLEGLFKVANEIEKLFSGKEMEWRPKSFENEYETPEIVNMIINNKEEIEGFLPAKNKISSNWGTHDYAIELIQKK